MNILKTLLGASGAAISAAEAKTRIDGGGSLFILDVRQPDEFRAGHIAGAKLIPLDELSARLGELPRDRDILCVCRSGSRSGAATSQLARAGLKAINLRGGMIGWQSAGYAVKKGR